MAEAKLGSELLAGGPVLLAGGPRPRQGPLEAARAIATDRRRTGALPVTWSHLANNVLRFQGLDTPSPSPRVPDLKDELLKYPPTSLASLNNTSGPRYSIGSTIPGLRKCTWRGRFESQSCKTSLFFHSVCLSVAPARRKSYPSVTYYLLGVIRVSSSSLQTAQDASMPLQDPEFTRQEEMMVLGRSPLTS